MKECSACHGMGHVEVKLIDRAGRSRDGFAPRGIVPCHVCICKGHITEEDRQRYYHGMGCGEHKP